jgi:hypothetical protein
MNHYFCLISWSIWRDVNVNFVNLDKSDLKKDTSFCVDYRVWKLYNQKITKKGRQYLENPVLNPTI